jgi:hypothetical protein
MLIAALVLVLPHAVCVAEARVLLRYDDYSSFQTDPRVIAFERALFEGIRAVGGHLIVGVIPFPGFRHPQSEAPPEPLPLPLGADKRELLKRYVDVGVVTPAVHGFNHGNNRRDPDRASEFAGLPERQQTLLLEVARRALQDGAGVDARVFVPPFNTYDAATLRAMHAAGFDLISAGRSGATDATLPVRYLPSTVHPRDMRRAVATALRSGGEGALIVVTLHPYDFTDTGNPLPAFRAEESQISLAQWLGDLQALAQTEGVKFVSTRELLDGNAELTPERFRANERVRFGFVASLPRFLDVVQLRAPDGIYYPTMEAQRLYVQQIVALTTVSAAACLLVWVVWRGAWKARRAAAVRRGQTGVR